MNITKPTLLLDKRKCSRNIYLMASKAKRHKLKFRPHFKTHQSAEIGNWFRDYGVDSITVSSVSMAKYFAEHGWRDITIAFPVNILEIDEINNLNEKINLNLLAESEDVIDFLSSRLTKQCSVLIKIDTDYNRTGVHYSDKLKLDNLVSAIGKSNKLNFAGFLTHTGQTYKAASKEDLSNIHRNSIEQLVKLKQTYKDSTDNITLSIGDTPACTTEEYFEGIDEIRPGNFVFYDVMQQQQGICITDQIAVCLVCPVVSIHKQRQEVVIYGGGVHLSKEQFIDSSGKSFFGLLAKINNDGWSEPLNDCYVKSLSQEHGILKLSEQVLNEFNVGDLIGVLPVHSCMTANLMKEYLTLDNQKITMMR